jgi:methionyl-tRNA formyltransferase
MSDRGLKRIGIFADGSVGSAILEVAVSKAADQIMTIVFASKTGLQDFNRSPLSRVLGSNCRRLSWPDLQDAATFQSLLDHPVDVVFLAWWPHILKLHHLQLANEAVLNIHPSLLPHCRGKDPNFWALIEQRPYGVTIHHVDETIDGGDIAFQNPLPVTWSDTGKSLYLKSQAAAVSLFEESLPSILAGVIPRIKQDQADGTMHYRRELEPASVLNLDHRAPIRDVLNRLRARTFEPHPACRFSEDGKTYEVRIDIREIESGSPCEPPLMQELLNVS